MKKVPRVGDDIKGNAYVADEKEGKEDMCERLHDGVALTNTTKRKRKRVDVTE
jgi:hypothetical protein